MGYVAAFLLGILAALDRLKQPQMGSHRASNPTDQGQSTPAIARPTAQVPPPVENQISTEAKRKHWEKNLKFWTEPVGVFVLAIYTATTIALWCAASDANKQANRNSQLDQRAWVAVSEIAPSDETKSPWEISIVFKNTGRTPAKNFAVELAGEPVPKGGNPTAKEDAYPGHGIIAPDGFFHSGLSSRTPFNWDTTDLVIHGKISYDSIFGHRHWTQFCYYFVPKNATRTKGGFTPCDQGNDVDGNEP